MRRMSASLRTSISPTTCMPGRSLAARPGFKAVVPRPRPRRHSPDPGDQPCEWCGGGRPGARRQLLRRDLLPAPRSSRGPLGLIDDRAALRSLLLHPLRPGGPLDQGLPEVRR